MRDRAGQITRLHGKNKNHHGQPRQEDKCREQHGGEHQPARAPKAKSKKATRLRIMPAPAADKALVPERDDAKAELIAWTEARERGDRVNLAVFEKKYMAACERLAKAQQKLAHGPDLRA